MCVCVDQSILNGWSWARLQGFSSKSAPQIPTSPIDNVIIAKLFETIALDEHQIDQVKQKKRPAYSRPVSVVASNQVQSQQDPLVLCRRCNFYQTYDGQEEENDR